MINSKTNDSKLVHNYLSEMPREWAVTKRRAETEEKGETVVELGTGRCLGGIGQAFWKTYHALRFINSTSKTRNIY